MIISKRSKVLINFFAFFKMMSGDDIEVELEAGERKPIILNRGKSLKLVTKSELHNCNDCPHPCI